MNFLQRISIQQTFVWGLLLGALVLLVGYGTTCLVAHGFHTTTVSAAGWLLAGCGVAGLFGVGLGVEGLVRSFGRDTPTWLPKANRIMIGGALVVVLSVVSWQMVWSWGATRNYSQGLYMGVASGMILLAVFAFGLGAMALGQKMGAEFLPGVGVVLVVFNCFAAIDMNNRGSYTDQASAGELYYAFRTPSGGPEEAREATAETPATVEVTIPVPLSAWEISIISQPVVKIRGLVLWSKTVYRDRVSNKPAYPLDYWDPNQSAWVDQWNEQAQAGQAKVESYSGLICLVAVVLVFCAGLFAAWWKEKISIAQFLGVGGALSFMALTAMCCGFPLMEMIGINPYVQVAQAKAVVTKDQPPFYDPFAVEAEGWSYLGYPSAATPVYLCHCGDTHRQVWLEQDWHLMSRYFTPQYAMAPHGCGRQLNVTPDHLYRVWNRASDATPVMKMMGVGESYVCPDGSTITAH